MRLRERRGLAATAAGLHRSPLFVAGVGLNAVGSGTRSPCSPCRGGRSSFQFVARGLPGRRPELPDSSSRRYT